MPRLPVAYKIYQKGEPDIIDGAVGLTYTWAGNGVFVEAENEQLAARIPVMMGQTRGLPNLQPEIRLKHGLIPRVFFDFILNDMRLQPAQENYYAIFWDGASYRIKKPLQMANAVTVVYEVLPSVVAEIHSHGHGSYQFSPTDNKDELGLKIYGVVGLLHHETPGAILRLGVYGYFYYIDWSVLFDAKPAGVYFYEEVEELCIE